MTKEDWEGSMGQRIRIQPKLVRFIPEVIHPRKKLFRIHAIQMYPSSTTSKQYRGHVVFGGHFLRRRSRLAIAA